MPSDFASVYLFFFFLMTRRPQRTTLFPYTTLFRSHAGRRRYREVEIGAGDRVGGAQHLRDLVRPAGVPDPAVDRLVDRVAGRPPAGAVGGRDLVDELLAPALQHLGDPVDDLAAVIGGEPGPARERSPGRP